MSRNHKATINLDLALKGLQCVVTIDCMLSPYAVNHCCCFVPSLTYKAALPRHLSLVLPYRGRSYMPREPTNRAPQACSFESLHALINGLMPKRALTRLRPIFCFAYSAFLMPYLVDPTFVSPFLENYRKLLSMQGSGIYDALSASSFVQRPDICHCFMSQPFFQCGGGVCRSFI